jgi:hypothetical protein
MAMQPSRYRWVRAYRGFFAAAILVAVAAQFVDSVLGVHKPVANFLSFFTIEANLMAAAVLLWGCISPEGGVSPQTRAWIRGAIVLYLAITGIVYGLLLAGLQEQLQMTLPWVDRILHRTIPVVLVADWLVDPPDVRLTARSALSWLAYPVVWLAYPYPFLNPAQAGGYVTVAAYSVAIALGAAGLAWLVVLTARHVQLVVRKAPIPDGSARTQHT